MRYVSAWLAALVCAGLGSSSLIASIAQGGTTEVTLLVDYQVHQTPVAPSLVGFSVSAADHGNGVASNGVEAAAIASTAQLRSKMARFPDDVSQSYHWNQTAGKGELSTFEFWSLAHEAEVPNIMITVNMLTGAPDEAARWVGMANQPTGTPNASQFRSGSDPFGIQYWLLGEDLADHLEKYPTAQAYAQAAIENATRMRAASPGIKIGLWIADGTTDAGVKYNTALLTSIRLLDPGQNVTAGTALIDFLAVGVDVRVPQRPLSDGALYPTLYSYAVQRADNVVAAAEAASSGVLLRELPIAVYRYGIDFGADGWNHEKADSLGVANALSGMVNAFARHEKLFTAIYRGLNTDGYDALMQVPGAYEVSSEQRFALNPFGEVLASYGQFLTGKTLSHDLEGAGPNPVKAFYTCPQVGGQMPPADHVPILSVEAALDLSAEQMVIFASSRSLSDRIVLHVVLAHTLPAVVDPAIVAHSFHSQSLSTDTYTGIQHVEPEAQVVNLPIATAGNGDLTFDLTLERNAVGLFTFTVKAA